MTRIGKLSLKTKQTNKLRRTSESTHDWKNEERTYNVAKAVWSIRLLLICVLINEISFELRMETISILMIFAVMLCYLSSSERKACWYDHQIFKEINRKHELIDRRKGFKFNSHGSCSNSIDGWPGECTICFQSSTYMWRYEPCRSRASSRPIYKYVTYNHLNMFPENFLIFLQNISLFSSKYRKQF